MTHSQSYPVTKPEKLPEQPHLKKVEVKSITCSGWCAFATAGALALLILLCISLLGGKQLFPRGICLYEGLIPLSKEGYLDVYPFSPGISTGIKKVYVVEIPPKVIEENTKQIQDILNGYPTEAAPKYRHCWLQNPSSEKPCYFDPTWISEFCSKDDDFGYREVNGTYSPCFLLKILHTGNWTPLSTKREELSTALQENYDPGFIPVDCKVYKNSRPVLNGAKVYPPKGFSHLYFPESRFNSESYLHPLVAVKVDIEKGQNVTIECSIISRNSLILWDNGMFSISFRSTA